MTSVYCVCGVRVEAADTDSLFAALRKHTDEVHAELGINDERLQGLLDNAAKMGEWDGEPAPLPGPIEIHRLTPDREKDFLEYFDKDAFVNNPGWSGCYCYYYRFDGTQDQWRTRGGVENRASQQAALASGEATGYLAYSHGLVVAWCHVAPRGDLPLLDAGATDDSGERVASVVCFNVKPMHRGQGVAKRLLDHAVVDSAAKGFTVLEGYPLENPRDNAQAYHGPLKMYLDAGFVEAGRKEPFVVVRRKVN